MFEILWLDHCSDVDTILGVDNVLEPIFPMSLIFACGVSVAVFRTNIPVTREVLAILAVRYGDAVETLLPASFRVMDSHLLCAHDRNEADVGFDRLTDVTLEEDEP